jgi:putative sterol carrier protein
MVDQAIIDEVTKLRENMGDDPKALLTMQELMKQASAEIPDLKEELEDIDQLIGQIVISDKDWKMWVKMGDGVYEYGEGAAEDASFTMTANWETMAGMMTGEVDGTSAYMSGDMQIDGNLQDVMAYGEYASFAAETMQEMADEKK